jgi:phosphatidylinositol glycan class W
LFLCNYFNERNLKNYPSTLYNTIKRSYILIALGLFRLASLKLLNYSYSINEYGVHWNFFFTIAAVKIVSTVFDIFICGKPVRGFLISFLIAVFYQSILSGINFSKYLLQTEEDRVNIFDANKEGLSSTIGCVAIYLAGQATCIYLKNHITENRPKYFFFY